MNKIVVSNLTKYYNEKIAVQNLSFTVKAGSIFGLLGANGAGKSTSIECILGTKKYDNGKVEILGLDPYKERRKVFEKVGVQFQDCAFQSMITVAELCEMTACVYKERQDYNNLLLKFGLNDKKKIFVSKLSGGERQRLFIVLALLSNPEVVFLDELTTGLDTISRKEVWKYLLELKESGVTVILTSHYMDEVEKLCDGILILNKGRTVFEGTIKEAISKSGKSNFEDAY
jgi:ABC-2 type transport system ATP-binding protein